MEARPCHKRRREWNRNGKEREKKVVEILGRIGKNQAKKKRREGEEKKKTKEIKCWKKINNYKILVQSGCLLSKYKSTIKHI